MLNISGIPVEINKKNIKNMRLYVKPPNGDVMVSAPLEMTNDTIERFVLSKVSWIKKQIAKFYNQQQQSERGYLSGETLYVWGNQYNLQVKTGKKNTVSLSGDTAILTTRRKSTAEQRKKIVNEWYRELLIAEIEQLLPKWEKRTNLKITSWQTRNMTSRWGSCKPKTGKILFNIQLAKKPPECLEYIILHELLHLVEKRHNEKFKMLLGKFMPTWKKVKKLLNNQTLDSM